MQQKGQDQPLNIKPKVPPDPFFITGIFGTQLHGLFVYLHTSQHFPLWEAEPSIRGKPRVTKAGQEGVREGHECSEPEMRPRGRETGHRHQGSSPFTVQLIALAKCHLRHIWHMHPWVKKLLNIQNIHGGGNPASTEHVDIFLVIYPTACFNKLHSIIAEAAINSNLGMFQKAQRAVCRLYKVLHHFT